MQNLQLFGSITSPYVRRLRIYMQDIEHQFVLVDIFSSRDRSEIQVQNPTMKVPMLTVDAQVILDSGNIFRYLQSQQGLPALSLDEQNLLSSIDAVNDSLVQMFILSRSEIDTSADKLYFRIQRERMDVVFLDLENKATEGAFSQWNYLSISLYCLLDWVMFRNLRDLSAYPRLMALYDNWHQLAICHETDPRQ